MNVAVVGLGKLGMPMAALFADRGHRVIGIDVLGGTVQSLNDRRDPYGETGLDDLLKSIPPDPLCATTDWSAVSEADVVFIVVPTPSEKDGRFSVTRVIDVIGSLGRHMSDRWRTIVVSSTVMPGDMDAQIVPAIEAATGRAVGTEIGAAYNPEFIALGSVLADMANPDFVLIGAADARSAGDVADVLEPVVGPAAKGAALSFVNAEITKLAVNCFLSLKISYANTLAGLCEAMPGADARVVVDAVGLDSRIGRKYLSPGGPVAGPCLPRDTIALGALAEQLGVPESLMYATQALDLAHVFNILKPLGKFKTVAILGMAYKSGTPVRGDSLGFRAAQVLEASGTKILWHDALVRSTPIDERVDDAQEAVTEADAVLVALADESYAALDYGDRFVVDVWGLLGARPNTFVVGRGAQ